MADPQPKVLNLTSEIIPLSSTWIMSFMTVTRGIVMKRDEQGQHEVEGGEERGKLASDFVETQEREETYHHHKQEHRQVQIRH